MKFALSIALLLAAWLNAAAQTNTLSGRVIDADTKAPLPFANVVIEGQNKGVSTDIDGKFRLSSLQPFTTVTVSFLGYSTATYPANAGNADIAVIKLRRSGVELGEVEILPGENPAHRIIRHAIANKKRNDPEQLRSFTYTSYNKMYVTADITSGDSIGKRDTTKMIVSKVLKKQHLFMSEAVSERKYLDGLSNETVIASRTSGLKESPFAILGTQMQSFSVYNDMLLVLDKKYLGPMSEGSTGKYLFIIEDTLYQGNDSVYVITFQPRKGKTFDALKGVLYINTNGYAVQNVIAEPVDNTGMLAGKIQQKYELVDNRQWFPVQLNTDWYYNLFRITDSTLETSSARTKKFDPDNKIKVVNRSYIKNIVIDPDLKKREFTNIETEILPDASSKPEEFWRLHRADSITQKELTTYRVVDSIGAADNLDMKMRLYEAMAFGKLPVKYIDIDLDKIYSYNEYEGNRLGIGIHTSSLLARWFTVGGYMGYGLRDKDIKYGGDASLYFEKLAELRLGASYTNDVIESGGVAFFEDKKFLSQESARRYLVRVMDKIEKKEASISFRTLRHIRLNMAFNTQTRASTNGYAFGIPSESTVLHDRFHFTEAVIGFRFAYREKFIKTPRYKASLGSDYPVVHGQVTRGLKNVLGGEFDYMRYDLKVERTFQLREYGKTTITLYGGFIDGDVSYTILYNGRGNYEKIAFSYGNIAFGTMRMNEFISDRYASLFFSHNFGRILMRSDDLQPEFIVISNMGFGSLKNKGKHFNIPVKTMEKGFYESGLLVNNLLASDLYGIGAGAIYRYGPYAFSSWKENIAAKFTLTLSF